MEDVPLFEAASAASDGASGASSDGSGASFELSGPRGPVVAFQTSTGSVHQVNLEDVLTVLSLVQVIVVLWLGYREFQR